MTTVDRASEIIIGGAMFVVGIAAFFSAIRKIDRYKTMRSIIGKFTIERPE